MKFRQKLFFYIFILSIFGATRPIHAQEGKSFISFFNNELSCTVPPAMRIYINQLIDRGNLHYKSNPDSAIDIYKKALHLSNLTGYARGKAIVWNNLSAAYKEKVMPGKAIICLQESMWRYRLMNGAAMPQQYVDLSDLYFNKGDYKGILELHKNIPLVEAKIFASNKDKWAQFQKYKAIAFFRLGNYDSALNTYYGIISALHAPNAKNFTTFVETYNGLGAVAARVGSDSQSLRYFKKALDLAKQYRDTNQIIMSLGNVAGAYLNKKNYPLAKEIISTALNASRQRKYYSYRSLNAYRMAIILNHEGQAFQALQYAKESYESAEKIKDFNNKIDANYMMGYTYFQLKNYKEAERYILPAMRLAEEKGKIDNIADAYSQLSEIYAHKGDMGKAYYYQKQYAQIKDSIRSAINANRIEWVEAKYKSSEKDKKLIQQQLLLTRKETKLREKNFLIIGIIILSLLLLTLAVIKYFHKQKLQAVQLKDLANRHEIEHLNFRMQGEEQERSRIAQELHDGISVLLSATKMNMAAIGNEYNFLTKTEVYQEVMLLLNQTAQEVRTISYNLVPELLIKQSLPAAVQAFCELIQKGHNLNFDLQIYGSFFNTDPSFNKEVYRIVQELIQNIVKHAHASGVLLQLTLHHKILQLTIEDNGIGFEENNTPMGMGLSNLGRRVESLNGQLSFSSATKTGTSVEIELPMRYCENKN